MKSAEEWNREWIGPDANNESSLCKHLKQVQLDAMKEGMRRAEKVASKIGYQGHCSNDIELQSERSARLEICDAILSAADNLALEDLK